MTDRADVGIDVFYPIVPDAAWLERIVPLGVKTVQLRVKGATSADTSRAIAAGLEVCLRHDCQLIINDHWREAMTVGADFVHLGQEDLARADIATLEAAGVRFGISTHNLDELDLALASGPAYVALGPIFATTTKLVAHPAQGAGKLAEWRRRAPGMPLVAIGGITLERAPDVITAGADSCAVAGDILGHQAPEKRVAAWLEWARSARRFAGCGA